MLLNKQNFIVNDFASKEESRCNLKAIQVSDKGTCATNGHVLVRISLPDAKEENFPIVDGLQTGEIPPEFTMPIDMAAKLDKAIPKCRLPILNHARIGSVNGHISAAVTDLDNPQVFSAKTPESTFPSVDKIMPNSAPKFEICLSAAYVALMAKAVTRFSPKGKDFMVLRFWDASSPVAVEATNAETEQAFYGLICPIYMSQDLRKIKFARDTSFDSVED